MVEQVQGVRVAGGSRRPSQSCHAFAVLRFSAHLQPAEPREGARLTTSRPPSGTALERQRTGPQVTRPGPPVARPPSGTALERQGTAPQCHGPQATRPSRPTSAASRSQCRGDRPARPHEPHRTYDARPVVCVCRGHHHAGACKWRESSRAAAVQPLAAACASRPPRLLLVSSRCPPPHGRRPSLLASPHRSPLASSRSSAPELLQSSPVHSRRSTLLSSFALLAALVPPCWRASSRAPRSCASLRTCSHAHLGLAHAAAPSGILINGIDSGSSCAFARASTMSPT